MTPINLQCEMDCHAKAHSYGKSEEALSGSMPAMLCFHNFARILTALIHISVTMYHKRKAAKSAREVFYKQIDFASFTYNHSCEM